MPFAVTLWGDSGCSVESTSKKSIAWNSGEEGEKSDRPKIKMKARFIVFMVSNMLHEEGNGNFVIVS